MAEPPDQLTPPDMTRPRAAVAQGIEGRNSGAEQRRGFGQVGDSGIRASASTGAIMYS